MEAILGGKILLFVLVEMCIYIYIYIYILILFVNVRLRNDKLHFSGYSRIILVRKSFSLHQITRFFHTYALMVM